eukprot:TRINITY_DN13222_c0_g1_i1.p1 TRINITY_DN13222_c0_g1~~TRINITY_DN13222_c0_g1_i1.p1  ORF type:complete len:278 (+),score=65.34 TRINITY_DN13222_c0_g1_i1:148-981(+)
MTDDYETPLILQDITEYWITYKHAWGFFTFDQSQEDVVFDIIEKYERGKKVRLNNLDPRTVGTLFHCWLFGLDEPLLTYELFPAFVDAAKRKGSSLLDYMFGLIIKIPSERRMFLKDVILFLKRYCDSKKDEDKETNLQLIAASFGNGIMNGSGDISYDDDIQGSVSIIVTALIKHYEKLFDEKRSVDTWDLPPIYWKCTMELEAYTNYLEQDEDSEEDIRVSQETVEFLTEFPTTHFQQFQPSTDLATVLGTKLKSLESLSASPQSIQENGTTKSF